MAIGDVLQKNIVTVSPASTSAAGVPAVARDVVQQPVATIAASPAIGRKPELTDTQVREAATTIGEAIGIIHRGLRVQIDESTNQVITQIINTDTNEVIRQVPAQELVELAHKLRELVGVLFDTEI